MKKGIVLSVLAIVLAVSVAIVGCAAPAPKPTPAPTPAPAPAPKPEPKDFPIGVLVPASGPYAIAGDWIAIGAIMAAEKINAAGGITFDGQPYKIKLIQYDTKYESEAARAAAERVIFQDKVKYIIGSTSADTMAFQPVTEQNKVIILAGGGAIYVSPKTPYTFRVTTLVDARYVALYEFVKTKYPDLKTVGYILPDTPVGQSYTKMGKAAADKAGFTVVAEESIALGSSDFSPQIAKVLSKKPDILDLGATGGGSDSALVIKQARQLGHKGLIVSAVAFTANTAIQVAGVEAMEGAIDNGLDPKDPKLSPEFRAYAVEFTKRFPDKLFNLLTTDYYDTCLAFFKFLDGKKTMEPDAFRDLYANHVWQGIYGKVEYGGEKTYGIKRQVVKADNFSQWKNGKAEIIEIRTAPVP